jgi:site-specific DNA-methyltransferase (adenine-specific)
MDGVTWKMPNKEGERGYVDNGSAARFFYCAKPSPAERGKTNKHPTVKSLKLMEYLLKLVMPPGGIVLDPFAGSGTTGIAAEMLGLNYVLIEQEQEYYEIIKKRIADYVATNNS